MPANSNVNFIPDDVLREKNIASTVNSLNKTFIIITIIISAAAIGIFSFNSIKARDLNLKQTQINQKTAQVDELKDFGIDGYKLGVRLGHIKSILDSSSEYTSIIDELNKLTPSAIEIKSWDSSTPTEIQLKGESLTAYSPISDFQISLKESRFFNEVKLLTASLDNKKGVVEFSLSIEVNIENPDGTE